MTLRAVRIYGDPALRTKAKEITVFDDELLRLVEDMHETMRAYNGVGLAGNQIGVLQRVAVVDVPLEGDERVKLALVNPEIVERSGSEAGEEGCLSIPGVYEDVTRALKIKVKAQDETGKRYVIEAEGYLARAIQHELDHLDGVLFVDRLSLLRRQFLRRTLDAISRGDIPEDYHPSKAGEAI
jgi:peptide deformylase